MPPSYRNSLPYKSHPLYKLRLAVVITAIVGFALNLFAIAVSIADNDYTTPVFITSLVFLFVSFVFCLHDVITYAVSKAGFPSAQNTNTTLPPATHTTTRARTTEEEPQWPSKRLVITDLVLAIILQWLFWIGFFSIINSGNRFYYSGGKETVEAYANLVNFSASILHSIAFWKEIIARKHNAWKTDLEAIPCGNCGHIRERMREEVPVTALGTAAPAEEGSGPSRPSILGRLGKGKVTLPKWNAGRYADDEERNVASAVVEPSDEEPLLATPDESTTEVGGPSGSQGYGTLVDSVGSMGSVPETVVKKKEKGKKRLVDVE